MTIPFKPVCALFLVLLVGGPLCEISEASPTACGIRVGSDDMPLIGPMCQASDFWIDWEIHTLLNSPTPNFSAVDEKISYEDSRIGAIVGSFGVYAEPAIFEALRSTNPHLVFRALSAIPKPYGSAAMRAACAEALGHDDPRIRNIAGGILLSNRDDGVATLRGLLESSNGTTVQRWFAAKTLAWRDPFDALALTVFADDFTKASVTEQVDVLPYFAYSGVPLSSAMIASLHASFDQMSLADRVQAGLNLAAFGSDAAPFVGKIVKTFIEQEKTGNYNLGVRGARLLDALRCVGREGDHVGVQAVKSLIVETPERQHAWYRDEAIVALHGFGNTALEARKEVELAADKGGAEARALLVILGVRNDDLSAVILGFPSPLGEPIKPLSPSTLSLLGPRTLDAALKRLNTMGTYDAYPRLRNCGRLAEAAVPEIKRRLRQWTSPDPELTALLSVISPNQEDYLPMIIGMLKDVSPRDRYNRQSSLANAMEDSICALEERALPLLDTLALTGDPNLQERADDLRESIKLRRAPISCLSLSNPSNSLRNTNCRIGTGNPSRCICPTHRRKRH